MKNQTNQHAYSTEAPGNEPTSNRGELLLASPGRGELILIVDDDPPLRDMMCAVLTEHGYRAITASSGIEAISIFIHHLGRIDAVFTDVRMPMMDGVTLCRQLRKLDPDICILASSGVSDPIKREELHSLHIRSVLSKPFTVGSLLVALGEILRPGHVASMS